MNGGRKETMKRKGGTKEGKKEESLSQTPAFPLTGQGVLQDSSFNL